MFIQFKIQINKRFFCSAHTSNLQQSTNKCTEKKTIITTTIHNWTNKNNSELHSAVLSPLFILNCSLFTFLYTRLSINTTFLYIFFFILNITTFPTRTTFPLIFNRLRVIHYFALFFIYIF